MAATADGDSAHRSSSTTIYMYICAWCHCFPRLSISERLKFSVGQVQLHYREDRSCATSDWHHS